MKALILVDIQKDFCSNGALAVPQGEDIIPLVNSLQSKFDYVVATQDFHPRNHKSFASVHNLKIGTTINLNGINQYLWPDHCVQGTSGVEFHPHLDMSKVAKIFPKGTNIEVDSYSGFFDNDKKQSTGLYDWLVNKNIDTVHIVGLALDYCVKATALDAKRLGLDTTVIVSATKAVNVTAGDDLKTLIELYDAGVKLVWI